MVHSMPLKNVPVQSYKKKIKTFGSSLVLSSEINAYQIEKVISISSEMISAYIFTVAFLDNLWLCHSVNTFHFRTSSANHFLICERKH